MVVWGGLTNSWEKKRREKQRRKERYTHLKDTLIWHHWVDGHEFEQSPGVGDEQRSLACCRPWGHKESDTTEWLNWTELIFVFVSHSPSGYFTESLCLYIMLVYLLTRCFPCQTLKFFEGKRHMCFVQAHIPKHPAQYLSHEDFLKPVYGMNERIYKC